MLNFFKNFVFPKTCLGCRTEGTYLCAKCIKKIDKPEYFICPVCQKRAVEGQTHLNCQRKNGLNGAVSLFPYHGLMQDLLKTIKFRFAYDVEPELKTIISLGWQKSLSGNILFNRFLSQKPVVVPVPLYWRRLKWRGFNQSEMIACLLAKKLKPEVISDLLIRVKNTSPQSELTKKKRRQNIKNAFRLNKKVSLIPGNPILLVDDIWTSGYTMQECGRVLKNKKAGEIWALTLAR